MVTYNFAAERRIRAGFIGCGMHSYKNIYPSFQYAPIELVAVADLIEDKAIKYARYFGAERHYTDYHEMLKNEDLDAVFIVTNIDENGNPRYPQLAMDVMRAGCHVWMEKPPASRTSEVEAMQRVSQETGKFACVGFKKMFNPAYQKVKKIMTGSDFGRPTTMFLRYQLSMGDPAQRDDDRLWKWPMSVCHPASGLHYLMGPIDDIFYRREPTGDTGAVATFANGCIGVIHFTGRQSATAPMEHVEVYGEGANVVVENGIRLTYYRRGGPPGNDTYYHEGGAEGGDYIGPDDTAPIYWEPQFSRGGLYNKAIFLLGYVGEIDYFCQCVLDGTPPSYSNLEDSWHITRVYEALRFGGPDRVVQLADVRVPGSAS